MDDPDVIVLLPAIDEQLGSPETPFVPEAYQRILSEPDIDEAEAKYMLAFCLADELEKMAAEDRSFDLRRYELLLSFLPTLPE
jgi:hypothetical protein